MITLVPAGEEFVERRGPSPLSVKADPDLGAALRNPFYEPPFRPKTFRTNFYPAKMDFLNPKNL
jgi:hypothetical protein